MLPRRLVLLVLGALLLVLLDCRGQTTAEEAVKVRRPVYAIERFSHQPGTGTRRMDASIRRFSV